MICVVDTGAANLYSIQVGLERVGASVEISSDPGRIKRADGVVIPGVGAAGTAIDKIRASGVDRVLAACEQPVLGICLGMQLLGRSSEEAPERLLEVMQLDFTAWGSSAPRKVHMGWSRIRSLNGDLYRDIDEGAYMYFAHSFATGLNAWTMGISEFGSEFSAGIKKDNFFGVQFHPEKSGDIGTQLLKNFVEMTC